MLCVCLAEAADLCVWLSDHTAKAFFGCPEIKRAAIVGEAVSTGMLLLKRVEGRNSAPVDRCRGIAEMQL